jgi:hypothetical protein
LSHRISTLNIQIFMNTNQKLALERLIAIAKGDTGQCRRVANFLLSWWNADTCGGWQVTDVWSLDRSITEDIFVVLGLVAQEWAYPNSLGYEEDFQKILRCWRPKFFEESANVDA